MHARTHARTHTWSSIIPFVPVFVRSFSFHDAFINVITHKGASLLITDKIYITLLYNTVSEFSLRLTFMYSPTFYTQFSHI
jgi:hypothetical protein